VATAESASNGTLSAHPQLIVGRLPKEHSYVPHFAANSERDAKEACDWAGQLRGVSTAVKIAITKMTPQGIKTVTTFSSTSTASHQSKWLYVNNKASLLHLTTSYCAIFPLACYFLYVYCSI
jgi:hypothetical protein